MSYTDRIREALDSTIDIINFPEAKEHFSGKVRETFLLPNENRAIVVTDRISSFDVVWGTVPFKGQVLNQIAAWWFRRLDGIIPHHLLDTPDPNISLVRNARVLPVEIVVRGYLTGSTSTSAWHHYQHCDRKICGIEMPEGMKQESLSIRQRFYPGGSLRLRKLGIWLARVYRVLNLSLPRAILDTRHYKGQPFDSIES